MRRTARPYFAALLLGALVIPAGPLAPQASARPPVPFLLAIQADSAADSALGGLLPRLTAQATPQTARARPAVQDAVAGSAPIPRRTAAEGVGTAARRPVYHIVVSGDTLWTLARRYGTSVGSLTQVNGLTETATLRLGQRLAVSPSVAAARVGTASRRPVYHVVVSGDTLWSLARRYGTSVGSLTRMNGLTETATLRLGQRLAVEPSAAAAASSSRASARGESSTVVVQAGQTLSEIAETNGVTTRALVEANGLRSAHAIRAGQRLTVPGRSAAVSVPTTRAAPPAVRAQASPSAIRLASSLQRGFFRWPARGLLTSQFGRRWRRHHNGIDIAAPRGTPIYAARGGLVAFAGWYYGYGLAVIIDHGGGVISLYGHASAVLVRGGQGVAAGQQIARVGCTGSCTGSHVHFEVRVNGRPVNPLRYL